LLLGQGKPEQNLIEAQYTVQLRLADAHFAPARSTTSTSSLRRLWTRSIRRLTGSALQSGGGHTLRHTGRVV